MYGIDAYLIRKLCEAGFGGYALTPNMIGDMTADQVWLLICEDQMLRKGPGQGRTKTVSATAVHALANEDGLIRGRAEDGTPLLLPATTGKSVASQIREQKLRERVAAQAKSTSKRKS